MLVQAERFHTPLLDPATESFVTGHGYGGFASGFPYDWNQVNLPGPSEIVSDPPISPSSWGDIEYQTEETQFEDRFIKSAWPILNQYIRWTDSPVSPGSGSNAEVVAWSGDPGIAGPELNSIRLFFVRGTRRFPVELFNALDDLQCANVESDEEGFPCPSDLAIGNADRLLREMYGISRRRYEVYPTADGEIAIDAPGGFGRSVVVLCDSDGGALCLVNMDGNHRRARYSNAELLPDGFVSEALTELELESDQTE